MKPLLKTVALSFSLALALGLPQLAAAQGGRFMESTDKAAVLDLATGLVWMRCPVGSTYANYGNGACMGEPTAFKRAQALDYLKARMPGWRLPSTKEVASLVRCESREDGAVLGEGIRRGRKLSFDSDFGFFVIRGDNRSPTACSGVKNESAGTLDNQAFPKRPVTGNTVTDGIWTSNLIGNPKTEHLKYYGFNPHDVSPSFDESYVDCGPGGCFGGSRRLMMAVAHESELQIDFGFAAPALQALAARVPATTLVWKASSAQPGGAGTRLQLDSPVPALDRQLLSVLSRLVAQETQALPELPAAPERADFALKPASSPKGEFETTPAYQERLRREAADADKQAEAKYQQALASHQALLRQREQRVRQIESDQASPQYFRQKLLQAWERLAPATLGNPVLTDIRYDADRQAFLATLRSTIGQFRQEISAPVPLDRAEKLKPDLVSGKIAPRVEFEFPSMAVTWALVENAALRARKFEEAATVAQLEDLIRDYPASAEARAARSRVFKVPKTSKELAAVIDRNRAWPEAAAAATLLRELQQQEFRQARADDRTWSYERFLENFGGPDAGKLMEQAQKARAVAQAREAQQARIDQERWERDRPAREAREARERAKDLCRAQVNTCVASCPKDRSYTSLPDSSCRSRCESVTCN